MRDRSAQSQAFPACRTIKSLRRPIASELPTARTETQLNATASEAFVDLR